MPITRRIFLCFPFFYWLVFNKVDKPQTMYSIFHVIVGKFGKYIFLNYYTQTSRRIVKTNYRLIAQRMWTVIVMTENKNKMLS